ncbi:regulatory protein GemA [Rhizobium sp. YJ-22]|uniref:regulatory protein GemA n=1 Tax=Rhizobium sp. YJ-22 TaxID=3037556 RepID=UPI002412DCB2|nr:regulatory protein GemA [Rhizobium sp. YJ-22]MDG3575999.1 regulatory protein GemA [Rhizobium sp. YJ-22]
MMANLNRLIFGGYRALQIDDEADQRAFNHRVTGESRLSLMSDGQKQAVADELLRLGFKPAAKRLQGQPDMSGKYSPKVQALWIALYNLGVVKDRRDSAILEFVKRQAKVQAMRFVHHHDDGTAVIEALKARAARAGVNWSIKGKAKHEEAFGCQIARAQWKILHPAGAPDFWPGINAMLGKPASSRSVSKEEWIAVMNELGARIRLQKKAGAK